MRAMKISLSALVLFCSATMAADATLEAARRCVQVTDSLQRLVCFDRAFAAAPTAMPAAAAAPASTPVVPVVPAVVPSLGDESLKKRVRDDAANEPTSLTAKVAGLRETRPNIFRITLDNGQVWQQMDMESRFFLEVGDPVQVERGMMGGYRMAKTGKNRSAWARVSRIK
jgi:hypothetical protein